MSIYTENDKRRDDIVMEILGKLNSPLTRAAVAIMLEDGMCTQEVRLEEYVKAKNIAEALEADEEDQSYYLSQNLSQKEAEELRKLFYETIEEHDNSIEQERL